MSDEVKAALRGRTLGAALVTLLGARVGSGGAEPASWNALFYPVWAKVSKWKTTNNFVCSPRVGCDLLSRVLSLIRGRKHLSQLGMDEICAIFIEHVGL